MNTEKFYDQVLENLFCKSTCKFLITKEKLYKRYKPFNIFIINICEDIDIIVIIYTSSGIYCLQFLHRVYFKYFYIIRFET